MPPGGFSSDPEKEQESSYNFFKNFFGGAGAAGSSTGASEAFSTGTQPQGELHFSVCVCVNINLT